MGVIYNRPDQPKLFNESPESSADEKYLARVKKLEPFDLLIHWIKERHSIYQRKTKGDKKPWTFDPILRDNRFTNVYRELDKTTIWYRKNVDPAYKKPEDVVFSCIAFRWFNLIATGEILLDNGLLQRWDTAKAMKVLKNRQPIFTGAFMISNTGSRLPKVEHVCKNYLEPAYEQRHKLGSLFLQKGITLEMAHVHLSGLPGFGGTGFMAAQVVCDLKYHKSLALIDSKDWWSWSCPGPGSRKGMAYLQGLGLKKQSYNMRDWQTAMGALRRQVNNEIAEFGMDPLHAMDLQNCCCELSKYVFILGGGRAKRKYR